MKFDGSFGGWLKQRRKALDLTQQELADQVACSVVTIRKIEGDVVRPSKQITERLAEVLAIAPDEQANFKAFGRRAPPSLPVLPIEVESARPVHNLPFQLTPFIGREPELTQIANTLAAPQCRLLTLVGIGGVGKTRIAMQAVAQAADNFAQGVCFVSLASVATPDLLPSAIGSAFNLFFYGSEEPKLQIAHYLREKHLLLVLDNFEHLSEGAGMLTEFLAHAPRLKLLVTSRERLNLHGEWVLPIEGLPFPDEKNRDEIGSYTAVQLFMHSAQRVQPRFSLSEQAKSVVEICQAVEGMPLAIELATAWLRAMPCHQIAEQIKRNTSFLAAPLRNIPERHQSMRAVFDQSWAFLSERDRGVLLRLSVFRGGFDVEAAEQVAGASLLILSELVDQSLIRMSESGRYDLHELLRQYITDKLSESGQATAIGWSHFEFFTKLAEQAEQHLYSPHQIRWFDRLDIEHNNLRAALAWALNEQDPVAGMRLAGALQWFWHIRCYWNEGCDWLEKLLAISDDAPVPVRAKVMCCLADLMSLMYIKSSSVTRATELFEQSLTLARSIGDVWLTAWSLSNIGFILMHAGKSDQAVHPFEEALLLFRELRDGWGINHTLWRLAVATNWLGNYSKAMQLYEEVLRLARDANATYAIAWALYGIGSLMLSTQQNDYQRMIAIGQECLSLFRAIGDKHGILNILDFLLVAARQLGDYELAERAYQEGLIIGQELGAAVMISLTFRRGGWLAFLQNQYERARQLLANSLIMEREIKRGYGLISCVMCIGILARAEGKVISAAHLLGSVEAITESDDIPPVVRTDIEKELSAARPLLADAEFAAAWAEGRAMSLDQAVAYALDYAEDLKHQSSGGITALAKSGKATN